jgi:DNA polymerase sigma
MWLLFAKPKIIFLNFCTTLQNQIQKKGRELKRRRQIVGKIREMAEEETKIKNILKKES